MHPAGLLVIYCGLCVAASLGGGWVPMLVRLTHRRMQIAISFVSGMILGIGLLHLLPHSFEALGSIDETVAWVLAGFLFMFFLERFFHFHHHDVPDDLSDEPHAHAHCDDGDGHEHSSASTGLSWAGVGVGLTLHSLVDGLALAAAVRAETALGVEGWAGIGAALAIALHKPFDSLSIATLLAASHRSARDRHWFNALYSLVTPLGVVLFYGLSEQWQPGDERLGQALGFAAGAFVCIASSDLLPELQFHRHDRASLSLALVAGIALAWSTIFLEGSGHGHSHGAATEHEVHEGHEHEAH